MHLTNFSLNKNSEKFKVAGNDFADINSTASKQLLTNVYKKLQAKGRDTRPLKRQIEELAAKTIIALEPYLKNAYHCFISTDHENPRCFQILGLDILIDENWNCWLMEVNANPSLNVYNDRELPNGDIEQTLSEIDKYVKSTLIADSLSLLHTAPLFTQKAWKQNQCYQSKTPDECGSLKLILP
jgi:tubulin polyglutamylase TTLL6/13